MEIMRQWIRLFLDYCRKEKMLADHSVVGYSIDMRMFMEFLEGREPPVTCFSQVVRKDIDAYVAQISGRYKVKTIRRKMACIRSFFIYLEDRGMIESNPFNKFRLKIKEPKRNPVSLTVSEMERFLRAVYGDPFAEPAIKFVSLLKTVEDPKLKTLDGRFFWVRDATIIELLFAAGLRVSELCGLRFESYDPVEHSIYIIGKGNRERTLYLEDPEVISLFHNYIFMRRAVPAHHSYIFITRFREPMSTQGVRNLVSKYTKISGINKNITPHAFRHSFASLLLESGVDIKYIQEFLGLNVKRFPFGHGVDNNIGIKHYPHNKRSDFASSRLASFGIMPKVDFIASTLFTLVLTSFATFFPFFVIYIS